ncbi:MAG: AAA family ATPase [Polaromonas sp.]|uniref:AAA family ATPase n=1 Tax=Polaromonas sp. TaxID=1869339 RepID=UPI0027304511|nr:AAA family ATPase [Polaromonas sp.]MDP2452383.1 AAA family ATPase [Polaromonas sp.]MDP3247811.1 AAA family ATPase [Polaromonas sp.]MDP3756789.1 AAA family ATPase [Polaromonas sp.]
MAITGFQIRRLTLVGRGVPNAEVQFREGLNVVSGPSDTGKTFIVQCIDYMLGGKDVPESIPEAAQYETVRISLSVSIDDDEVILERSIRGGDFKLVSTGKADQHLSAKHSAADKDSLSQYLLSLARLAEKKVRTNKQGKTREVSFRDLARLILVDEETIISKTSPILSGQYTAGTAESAVFRLLLTGVDDSSLISSEDPKVAKGRQAGKVEMLDLLLNQTKGRMAEMQLPGDVQAWQSQLAEIETLFETAQKALAVEQQNAAQLEGERRAELSRLRQLESKSGVLRELQRRFTLLEQQYLSDLRRLESIAEAGARLGQMNEERCPVCGAAAEHQEHEHQKADAGPEDVAQSCLAEAAKIRSLISDLRLTRSDNDREIARLEGLTLETRERVRTVATQLSEMLKPRVEVALLLLRESQTRRDTYRRALELHGRVNELQGLLGEHGLAVSGKGAELESARVRSDEAEAFSQEVESLLRAWHFPGLDRVTFSEGDQDIVISGRTRASHGKGVRAIAHAAFNLALLKFCIKFEMPHPGFTLIDSPLVVYREPDTDEGDFSHDVKDAFYRSIAEEFRASQVIIFENEDPPSDLGGDVNIIRFTGASHGRQGFIPQNGR